MKEGKLDEMCRRADAVAFRDGPIFVNGHHRYLVNECAIKRADQGVCIQAFHCEQCRHDIVPMKNTTPKECPRCYAPVLTRIGTGSWTSANTFTMDD
jgi:hypothetical protein